MAESELAFHTRRVAEELKRGQLCEYGPARSLHLALSELHQLKVNQLVARDHNLADASSRNGNAVCALRGLNS